MRGQLESLGQQCLHHQPHLIFCSSLIGSFSLNVEAILRHPLWQPSQHRLPLLRRQRQLISEADVRGQRKIPGKSPVRLGERVPGIQGEQGRPERSCIRPYGRDFKRPFAPCLRLPVFLLAWEERGGEDSDKDAREECFLKPHNRYFAASAASIARVTSADSGSIGASKRASTLPLRSTRYLVKFHGMVPAVLGFAAGLVRNWYKGA